MVIGIDYTAALHQGGGIGRYTRELVRALVAQGQQHQYRLFFAAGGIPTDSPYRAELWQLCATFSNVRAVPIPLSPRRLTQFWQRLRAPLPVEIFTGRLDLVHAPDFVLPPTLARTLLTVHDLSFLVYPELTVPSMVRYLASAVPRATRRADHILADSLATQRDLVRLLGVPATNIDVVYPGLSAGFMVIAPEACAEVKARLELPERFLVFVSTLSPRKNVERLVEAFALLVASGRVPDDLALILIGGRGWMDEGIFAAIERVQLGERVRWLRFVRDTDLPAVYNLAAATVYPSLYEGFGLPVIEALACGSPVVTADNSSLPEAAGDAAVLVDARSIEAIADGIALTLADGQLRARNRKRGLSQVQRFTWQNAAAQVLERYSSLF